jgi:hypothetical protein
VTDRDAIYTGLGATDTSPGTRDLYPIWKFTMNQARVIGIVLIVVGIGLFTVGMNSSHSVADQVSKTFTGRFTEATTWYILGGLGAGIAGAVMLLGGLRGRSE